MNVLVIGAGAREHAIVHALHKSRIEHRLFALPGNPGMATLAELIPGDMLKLEDLRKACTEHAIELVLFGPEAPLALGLADEVRSWGIPVFGPGKQGAMLETSKLFAKEFMFKNNIPTARYQSVSSFEEMMEKKQMPVVIKADGLAQGKGVFIPSDETEFEEVARALFLDRTLGGSADTVLLEEKLEGPEVSFFYLVNEAGYFYLGCARDYKRAYDGDLGPNTGGMGAVSPVILSDEEIEQLRDIMERTYQGMIMDNMDYRGVIFIGCMRTSEGLKVLEYNVRFGDPETQALLLRLEEDFLSLVYKTAQNLNMPKISKRKDVSTVCVNLCSAGYPGEILKGQEITIGPLHDVTIFHGGTSLENGRLVTSGGRVMSVVGIASSIEQARKLVYDTIDEIRYPGRWYRKDIAHESNR